MQGGNFRKYWMWNCRTKRLFGYLQFRARYSSSFWAY